MPVNILKTKLKILDKIFFDIGSFLFFFQPVTISEPELIFSIKLGNSAGSSCKSPSIGIIISPKQLLNA